MSETLRAFVAIELPDDARRALAGVVEELRLARIPGLRPVRPEGIHLTLKFLGDVPQPRIEPVAAALAGAARTHGPFVLTLEAMGVFPLGGAPRVLWAGLAGDLAALRRLQREVDDALEPLGFQKDLRAFNPHLTVARIRNGTSKADRQLAARTLSEIHVQSGVKISVESVELMRSKLTSDGAIYASLKSIPLAR